MPSNTLGGVNLSQIAQMTLDALLPKMPLLKAFTTNFSADVASKGEAVITRVPTATTCAAFSSGYAADAQNATSTAKTVTLSNHIHSTVGFNDAEWSKSSVNLFDVFIKPLVSGVVNDMVDDVMALVTNANFGAAGFTGAASTLDADDVADMAEGLTTANVPRDGRFLILKPTYHANLAKDNAIQASYAYGGSEAIREGRVPRVHGFDVYEYTDIPGNSENLVGLYGAPQGLLIAARVPAIPDNFPGLIENVTDPDSGLTIQLRKWYSADDGQHYLTGTLIHGVAVGVSGNVKRIVSA